MADPIGPFSGIVDGTSVMSVGGSFCTTVSQLLFTRSPGSAAAVSGPGPQRSKSTGPVGADAVELVGTVVAAEQVAARTADDLVVTRVPADDVVTALAEDPIAAAATGDPVVTRPAADDDDTAPAAQHVVAAAAGELVVAAEPADDVVAIGAGQHVVGGGAEDGADARLERRRGRRSGHGRPGSRPR